MVIIWLMACIFKPIHWSQWWWPLWIMIMVIAFVWCLFIGQLYDLDQTDFMIDNCQLEKGNIRSFIYL